MTLKIFELQGALRGEGKIIRQTGGMHRYGHVILCVEPVQSSLSLAWEVSAEQIPDEFKDAVFRGINAQFRPGARFDNYTTDGLRIRIVDGSSHQTDSNEGSFEIASSLALLNALEDLVGGPT
jgi:elongation factor G